MSEKMTKLREEALAVAKSLRSHAGEPWMKIGARAFANEAAHIIENLCAALAAEEESGWRAIEITGLSVLDDGRAEARFDWPSDWPMKIGPYRLAKDKTP